MELKSKDIIIVEIKRRFFSKPKHLRGAEVLKICKELKLHRSTIYRYLQM